MAKIRFIQIAVSQSSSQGEYGQSDDEVLIGLDVDGRVWEYRTRLTEEKDEKGRSIYRTGWRMIESPDEPDSSKP